MMNWYNRYYEYEDNLLDNLKKSRVLIIYGPRRVGKTSLIKKAMKKYKGKYFFGAGEDLSLKEVLGSSDIQRIKSSFSGYDLIIIDEAQEIKNIGTGLKIIVDHLPDVKVIASGSSSFKLLSEIGEPLTGRGKTLFVYPLSIIEIKEQFGGMEVLKQLENYLIYGTYPETLILKNISEKSEYLINLRNSYLFKDIFELENIRNSDKISDLLRLLAFQIGKEVSLNELSKNLGIAKQTVAKYLDLLEKNFIIKKVRGFSRNLRKEIAKSSRYYFIDNGIRNSIISNFNSIENRDDIGMLWENFLFTERMKKLHYKKLFSNVYFWRTHDKKEIDLVEERDGKLFGFEFKWGDKKKKLPSIWFETYENSSLEIITKKNFLEFLTD